MPPKRMCSFYGKAIETLAMVSYLLGTLYCMPNEIRVALWLRKKKVNLNRTCSRAVSKPHDRYLTLTIILPAPFHPVQSSPNNVLARDAGYACSLREVAMEMLLRILIGLCPCKCNKWFLDLNRLVDAIGTEVEEDVR